jgi:hypothetical protein
VTWRARTIAALLATTALAASCTGERPRLVDEVDTTSTTGPAASTTTSAPPTSEVAEASGAAIEVFADATTPTPAAAIAREEATSAPDIPMVFLVIGSSDDRLQVRLPTPPGGGTGWVRRADVSVSTVTHRVEVVLGEHRLRVLQHDGVVIDEPIAVGPDRPAPGPTYLKELLQPPDGGGPYGAYVYGFAGFATDLNSFNTGEGIVGLHAARDPSTLGQDVAAGSIQVHPDLIARLVTEVGLPLGTPVDVSA